MDGDAGDDDDEGGSVDFDDDGDDDDGGDVEPRRAPGRPHRGRLYRRRQECTDGTCR